ncbi:proheparin-binding EGF-like growth factor [Pelodytes ibericus]
MRLMKTALLIFVQVSYIGVHGTVIGYQRNAVLNKGTNNFAAVGEIFPHEDKVFTTDNHIIASPRALSSSKTPVVMRQKEGQNRKRKGRGRKRNPCQRKYKDFCIHGDCRYLKALKEPSCICQAGYHGERCHALSLPLENPANSYDHTTMLALLAVVLSSFCLVIISSLLALRYHKRGTYSVENEEKIKWGIGA